jgi:GT2 family glycosyltransferase
MIPKIIHQIWIGPRPAPEKLMATWKEKNPSFEYIRWSEKEFEARQLHFSCLNRIHEMEEINGKADIIRWEILYHYGGFFFDADSFCVMPLNEYITQQTAFSNWENELSRPNLIATVSMGFPPKHPLVKACIEYIQQNEISNAKTGKRAWLTVGPGLITRMMFTGLYKDVAILPSYHFLPIHHLGNHYRGHGIVYAHQEWGTNFISYDNMNNAILDSTFDIPPKENTYQNVSVLICSYNTKQSYIRQCLDSIKAQNGYFSIEVVWVDDGSDEKHRQELQNELVYFLKSSRFTTVRYVVNSQNLGVGYSLNRGVRICSNEIVCRMDSDDWMIPKRIQTQMAYMEKNPDCKIVGAQARLVQYNPESNAYDREIYKTSFPTITLEHMKEKLEHWFVVHPTVCFRKSAIESIGNYQRETIPGCAEDYDLWLRVLKEYKIIHNLPDVLVYYRVHENQVTQIKKNIYESGEGFQERVKRAHDVFGE